MQPPIRHLGNHDTRKQEDFISSTWNTISQKFTSHAVLVGLALVACLSGIVILLMIKRKKKQAFQLFDKIPSSLTSVPLTTKQVMYIETAPQTKKKFSSENYGAASVEPPRRMKLKGLLERRGSNASLKLNLNSKDSLDFDATTDDGSPLEFLRLAKNPLTHLQLTQIMTNMALLRKEFGSMPLGHAEKLDIPGANSKNRYKSIWPNHHTRVILQDDDFGNNYINANFIEGLDGNPKAFIATQGPLVNTVDDFWRAVWQEGCPAVVMMTKLRENTYVKCEPYLPELEQQYGHIRVSVHSMKTKAGYTVRDVHLKKNDVTHFLKHFWFTGWPDQKAPISTASQLIDLIKDVEKECRKLERKKNACKRGPILVHCSAGLGRTGCFIATTIGMQQLRQNHKVDVLGIVCQMRLQRGGMVQTLEQYEFIYHALALFGSDNFENID